MELKHDVKLLVIGV